ncbi:hypothetical protein [Bifidobacterium subtile]|uniref:Uncharacterized protein n=1 Tax=Bifidobacterium subtile TaxID=77635 RepID=A0A087EBZ1_9BIFI|nr:hypothetical protein [Bifidobacterium subtile]KFJ05292.1 hypothetical protein BISU_1412 [Bifidobacterium subtile]QOL36681.1 hypothetical protein BS3272_01365 [Bifidobacterium subtile]
MKSARTNGNRGNPLVGKQRRRSSIRGPGTTRLATEKFLRVGNPKVIGSRNNYALLPDWRDASTYALDTDWRTARFDSAWFAGADAQPSLMMHKGQQGAQ